MHTQCCASCAFMLHSQETGIVAGHNNFSLFVKENLTVVDFSRIFKTFTDAVCIFYENIDFSNILIGDL